MFVMCVSRGCLIGAPRAVGGRAGGAQRCGDLHQMGPAQYGEARHYVQRQDSQVRTSLNTFFNSLLHARCCDLQQMAPAQYGKARHYIKRQDTQVRIQRDRLI